MEARTAVFVDASGWIALLLPRDENHRRAIAIWSRLRQARAQLMTSNLVLAEAHALLLSRLGHEAGQRFLRSALGGEAAEVVWVDDELTVAATEAWVYRRPDKAFSLADAASFEIMQQRRLAHAFSFDQDFARAGFTVLK